MHVLDEKGRLFGKVSIIDIIIIITLVGLAAGFVYQRLSGDIKQVISANEPFYVTFKGDQVRAFSVNSISEGDIIYKRYDNKPLGAVKRLDVAPGIDILFKSDGTAALVEMEDRYTLYITVECAGNITERGYYANGYMQLAPGNEVMIQSNRLLVHSVVHRVGETPYEP